MNTRKILLVTSDKDLSGIVKISALTLTKLNCQVSIEETSNFDEIIKKSNEENLDMIIADADHESLNIPGLIREIRNGNVPSLKKIITIYSGEINRDEYFKAGCDSVMSKDEFKRVVNNILQH